MRFGRGWRLFRHEGGSDAGPSLLIYILLFVACIAAGQWSVERYQSVLLWPANGVLLAALLQLHKRQAIFTLAVCAVINITGNILRADPLHMLVLNVVLNFAEVAVAALLVRRLCGATLDLRRPTRLARFVVAIAIPVALSALIGVTARGDGPDVYLLNLTYWFTIETLGFLVTTPGLLLLASRRRDIGTSSSLREKAVLFGLLVAVTAAVFLQDRAPVLFLIFLPLLVIAFRLPPRWSAVAVMTVSLIGGAFSLNGLGPITLSDLAPDEWPQPDVIPALNVLPVFHLFVSAMLAVSFGASTILSERRRLELQLQARTDAALAARAKAEAAENRVSHMAHHDDETGLMNRLGLAREVAAMMSAGRGVHVAALEVDRFTAIRTAIGAVQSARLLAETAARVRQHLPLACVARLSTTGLGVAFRADNLESARDRLVQLRSAFAEPVAVGASRVDVRLIAGVAGAVQGGDAHALIQRAQAAVDQAGAAKIDVAVFDAAAEQAAASNLTLMSELREGLASGAVWLAHQPKLDLRTGAVSSVECLIRWRHPARGAVAPDAFIPLAEKTGFITPLTDWLLDRALTQQAELARAGHALSFAINISARSLCEPAFGERLAGIAAARGGDAKRITLEITETAVMERPERALANLEAMKRAGFSISIDDYGAGMSSLSYLKRIPADELKIDSSFIHTLASNKNDAVLVRSTIDLGHRLGLKVVAEGVEDQETLDLLALFGCDAAQGYLIARPTPIEELADRLATLNVRPRPVDRALRSA